LGVRAGGERWRVMGCGMGVVVRHCAKKGVSPSGWDGGRGGGGWIAEREVASRRLQGGLGVERIGSVIQGCVLMRFCIGRGTEAVSAAVRGAAGVGCVAGWEQHGWDFLFAVLA